MDVHFSDVLHTVWNVFKNTWHIFAILIALKATAAYHKHFRKRL